ncbi:MULTISPECIES: hypothetical protein [Yersinia]|uniref:Uncharacterized protein n=1 Tax=Yersinia frederiksenii TaxID=29484 RepID=A0AAI8ZPN4_YERFR|nr:MULTISPECIES: hypothetical protein [Yersinia]EKN4037611.1 hypothetical protein [Yersinia enterocolitica]EKN5125000.1 hypothetical protein [Yersinia enterocolitica]EKN5130169.1 hypothetical protein [Yersinia enterocolitica]EKN6195690.1 hypothetical protein [Yersinia enterocolitica]ELI7980704.1 hypothetical protein [Yersinia enterocolitica]
MLDKIIFKGFEVTSSEYNEYKDAEGGKFRVLFDHYKLLQDADDDGNREIIIEAAPSINGYSEDGEDEDDLAFKVKIALRLYFDFESDRDMTEDECSKNSWFFDNFVSIATKLTVESTLKHTSIKSIELPWSRPKK